MASQNEVGFRALATGIALMFLSGCSAPAQTQAPDDTMVGADYAGGSKPRKVNPKPNIVRPPPRNDMARALKALDEAMRAAEEGQRTSIPGGRDYGPPDQASEDK